MSDDPLFIGGGLMGVECPSCAALRAERDALHADLLTRAQFAEYRAERAEAECAKLRAAITEWQHTRCKQADYWDPREICPCCDAAVDIIRAALAESERGGTE